MALIARDFFPQCILFCLFPKYLYSYDFYRLETPRAILSSASFVWSSTFPTQLNAHLLLELHLHVRKHGAFPETRIWHETTKGKKPLLKPYI